MVIREAAVTRHETDRPCAHCHLWALPEHGRKVVARDFAGGFPNKGIRAGRNDRHRRDVFGLQCHSRHLTKRSNPEAASLPRTDVSAEIRGAALQL